MTTVVFLLVALIALVTLYLVLRPALRAYLTFKGTRVVTCPETQESVVVEVDARHAATTAARGHLSLRLQDCSRWPERRNCGQDCLKQVEAAPVECLLRTILTKWYKGKVCVLCRKPIPEINWLEVNWLEQQPALMDSEGRTFAWDEFPPERLPLALATHRPVCWSCHHAESFRRRFPELVVDRPEH
jgi:hypothetical protein